MDKAIVTTFMIIASVVVAVMIFNTVYPAVMESGQAMVSMKNRVDRRLQNQIEVIHAAPSGGYSNVVLVWIKNIGSESIQAVERCDVFFGPENSFGRIPYGEGSSHWTFTIENDTAWKPTATLMLTIELPYSLSEGERYYFKITTPVGIADEYYFSK